MAGGTTIVDRLNKLSGKDATTIAKALQNLEEGGGIGGFEIHICASGEYDAETKVPTITKPDTSTLYLVPTSSRSKNMFDEYVWTGTDWEKFGTGSVALPSVIEIARWYGSYAETATGNFWYGNGGGQLLGRNSLRSLIGDKKIVGLELEGTRFDGDGAVTVDGIINMSISGSPWFHNLIVHQDSIRDIDGNKVGGGMVIYSTERLKPGEPIRIYAICV